MRVLTVTNWYPPHHQGGYELSCFDVMTRFEARGHEVHVLCGDTRFPGARLATDAAHEARVQRALRLHHDGTDVLRPSWRERVAIERHNQAAFQRAVADVRPDVISVWHLAGVSHGLLSAIAATGVPVVFAVCDDWLVYGVGLDPWMGAFDRTPLRRLAGRVVGRFGPPATLPDVGAMGVFLFVSHATQRTAATRARWAFPRAAVVWSGIDRTTYGQPPDKPRPWRWRLVSTGRFDPRKGYETVLRALALLPPEASLHCWGRGGDAEVARLRSLAAELGVADRVHFGALERDELPAAYAAADAMVFPSTWAEPFGLVPVEAMACATPVVATGVGGSGEFLHHDDNCLVFEPGCPTALAAALQQLAGDDARRARLVEAGLGTVELLDVERLADVMEAWHRHEAAGAQDVPPSPREGVDEVPAATVREVAPGQVVVSAVASSGPRALGPADAPPTAVGELRLVTTGLHPAVAVEDLVGTVVEWVAPGGRLVVEGPNRADLRIARDRALARWRGWRRAPGAAPGALDRASMVRLLEPYGSVVRSTTGRWDGSRFGRGLARVAGRLLAERGPLVEVELVRS